MSKKRITRADLERAKCPLSLLPHSVDVHEFKPVRLARGVVLKPAPTVGDMAAALMRRKPGTVKS